MPLPDRFAHWLQAADEDLLDYDAEHGSSVPSEDLLTAVPLPWEQADWPGRSIAEDD